MAFTVQGVPFKLNAADIGGFGGFDLGQAIRSGLQNANLFQETRYKPQQLQQDLYAKELANKINEAKSKYAEQQESMGLRVKEAHINQMAAAAALNQGNLGLIPYYKKLYEAQASEHAEKVRQIQEESRIRQQILDKQFGNKQNLPVDQKNSYIDQLHQHMINPESLQDYESQQNINDNAIHNYGPDLKKAYERKIIGLPAELPEEKTEREVISSNIKEQGKSDIKRAQQIIESAKDLELAGIDVTGIHDILSGTDGLGTGITKTLISKLGWGSEKLGAFNERAIRLQSQMARALSQRGGVGAANIVASGKPSSWKSTSENLGITDAYADRIKNEFDLLNEEYQRITGKKLPYKLPEYVHNIANKVNNNIFKPKTIFNSEQEFHSYMNSLKPNERKMVILAIRKGAK